MLMYGRSGCILAIELSCFRRVFSENLTSTEIGRMVANQILGTPKLGKRNKITHVQVSPLGADNLN